MNEAFLVFGHQVASDSLRPHGVQHARPLSRTVSQSLPKFPVNEEQE